MCGVVTEVESNCSCQNCVQGAHPSGEPQTLGGSQLLEGSISSSVGSLLSGYSWGKQVVTYAFPDSPSDYNSSYYYNEPFSGFKALNGLQKSAAHKIFDHIEQFVNLTFVQGAQKSSDIKIAESGVPKVAWGYYPGRAQESGDIWLGANYDKLDTPQLGNYAFTALMHEIGHALGLKHAFSVEKGYAPIARQFDAMSYTVMSYKSHANSSINFYGNESNGYAQSFMMLDIAFLQQLYGANTNYNSGNTIYSWNPNTGEMSVNGVGQGVPLANRVFSTLWDGGGYDVYDLTQYDTDMHVTLMAGEGSVFDTAQLPLLNAVESGAQVYAEFNVMNALQYGNYEGSLIDEVNAGSGNDTLIGNHLNNTIRGNDGNDVIFGGVGDDYLIGGRGNDVVYGGSGRDVAVFQNTAENSTLELRDDGTVVVFYDQQFNEFDTFSQVERVLFSDRKLAFDIDGNAGQAYRLYQATFDRTPDEGGLGFWITALDNGMKLQDVSQDFVSSTEFKALTGQNPSSHQFVNAMYQNVLQRGADQTGLDYWQQRMDEGMSRSDILLEFSESIENINLTTHATDDGIWYL